MLCNELNYFIIVVVLHLVCIYPPGGEGERGQVEVMSAQQFPRVWHSALQSHTGGKPWQLAPTQHEVWFASAQDPAHETRVYTS